MSNADDGALKAHGFSAQAMAEFCEQVNPSVLRDLRETRFQGVALKKLAIDTAVEKTAPRDLHGADMLRLQESWVSTGEKRALLWLAQRTPEWIGPDHLTALGFVAQIGAGAGYALAARNPYALLAVIACLALNWLGDSLDGTLARVRRVQRPRYGFYVDHMVDSFGALALMAGLAFSGYMNAWIATGLLVAFLMLSIQSYLATHALGEFRLSFWRFGPTELRILLALGNLALLWKPALRVFGVRYRLFDVGGALGLAGMGAMLIAFTLKNTLRLYREDRIAS